MNKKTQMLPYEEPRCELFVLPPGLSLLVSASIQIEYEIDPIDVDPVDEGGEI